MRLRDVIPARPARISFDEYVPFSVEFAPTVLSADESFYWRRTDGRHLLEVKLAAADGALVECTLVLVSPESVTSIGSVMPLAMAGDERQGHPLFDLAPWLEGIGHRETGVDPAARRIDDHAPFNLAIASDGAALVLGAGRPSVVLVDVDVRFWFDSRGELSGIALTNVDPVSIAMLRAFGR
jgi:hypothetical protein